MKARRVLACVLLVVAASACRPHIACQEDMPCWDCHSMGNHICGPGK